MARWSLRSTLFGPFRASLTPLHLALGLAAIGTIGAAPAARAETQLLYLAEDVPAGLDFDGPAASTNTSQAGYINLLEPLVSFARGPVTDEGVQTLDFSKFESRLAESWEFDEPSLTWTFHLRHGVKSCAGNTFTADDVIYSLARAKSVSGASAVSWFLPTVASVEGFTRDVLHGGDKSLGNGVTKVDDYTVKIKQSAKNALLLQVMTVYGFFPLDSVEMKKHATEADPWSHVWGNNTNQPGFGAYCVERWVRDDEFVLAANPNYYRGKPAIDRVIIKRVPQSSNRALSIRGGQAQLTGRLATREFEGLRHAPGVKVAGIYGNETLLLSLNFKTKPFDNPKLRQALAELMPYKQIATIGYSGQARKWDAHFTEVLNGFDKPDTQWSQDPAKGKQLLAEAGYPDGKGLEAFADSFKLSYPAERESTLGPIATVIQSALKDAGVPVLLDPLPQTQLMDRRMVKKDLPMSLGDTEKPAAPAVVYATMLFFVSPAAGGINNFANYSSPKVDELFSSLRGETDPAKRASMLQDLQNTLQSDLAWIPLEETKTQWAFSAKLHGITWYPDNSLRFFDLSLDP